MSAVTHDYERGPPEAPRHRSSPTVRRLERCGAMASGEARPGALCYSRTKVLRTAVEGQDGFLFSHTGDGVVAAFASPR